ncbi:MAG: hypothetical protein IJY12_03890 [Clostridia bacterium]|nr:hypothetical protein [Clostridia bacterium]
MTEKWYLKSQEEIESVLNTSAADGLAPSAAALRLRTDGGNNIFSLKRRTALRVAIRECFDLPAILLLFVMAINGLNHESILCMIVVLASVIFRTLFYIRSMHVFSDMAVRAIPRARVVRGKRLCRIDSRRVVQGDLIYLQPGDFVPADARIIKGKVRVSEYRVTGKKAPSEKENGILPENPNMELSLLTNMVFAGSRVVDGRAMAIVTDTGDDTLLMEFSGRISISTYERMPLVRRMAKNCTVCEMILLTLVVVSAFLSVAAGAGVSIVRSFIFSLSTVVTAVSECYFAYVSHVISHAILALDGTHAKERTLIKDMRLLDALADVDFVLIRDCFTREDGGRLSAAVAQLERMGVRPILLTDRVEYGELFFGKLSCFAPQKDCFHTRAKFLAATDARLWQMAEKVSAFSCLDTEESLRLLRVLQVNGATVAVLTSDKQDADLLREADISATVAPISRPESGEVSEMEMIADVHIPGYKRARGSVRALGECIRLAKTLPARLNALFGYYLASAAARLVLCLYGIFAPNSGITPYCILAGGLLPDLVFAAVLAATEGGKHGNVPRAVFRYRSVQTFLAPALAGLISAGAVLLAWTAEHHFVKTENDGFFLLLMLVSSVFNGIAFIRRERVATTPLGWLPTLAFGMGVLAVFAVLLALPPVGTLLLVQGFGVPLVLIAIGGGILQIFCQKILFGTKILIQNY